MRSLITDKLIVKEGIKLGGVIRTTWPSGSTDVKLFGAKGDGIADDTVALQAAINTGLSLFFPAGTYKTTAKLNFNFPNATYEGVDKNTCIIKYIRNVAISADTILGYVNAERVTFNNLGFTSGNGILRGLFYMNIGANNFTFKNCLFTGINNTLADYFECYAIWIRPTGIKDFIIDNCRFSNISNQTPADNSYTGFCGGIAFFEEDALGTTLIVAPSSGKISNNQFFNIFSVYPNGTDVTNSSNQDADAIRSYVNDANIDTTLSYDVVISDNIFHNVQKSAVKLSGTAGFTIKNNEIYSYRSTSGQMTAGLRIQPTKSCRVTDNIFKGHFYCLINIIGEDVIVDGVTFLPIKVDDIVSSTAFMIQNLAFVENNIVIKNVNVSGVPSMLRQEFNTPSLDNPAMFNIILKDWNCFDCSGVNNNSIGLERIANLVIDNVSLKNLNTLNNSGIYLADCSNVFINNLIVEAQSQCLRLDQKAGSVDKTKNIKISNSNFYIKRTSNVNPGIAVINLSNDTTATTDRRIQNVVLENLYIEQPLYLAFGNNNFIQAFGNFNVFSNIVLKWIDTGFGLKAGPGIICYSDTNDHIKNITMISENLLSDYGTDGGAVVLYSTLKTIVQNVTSDGKGVIHSNTTDCVISNVIGRPGLANILPASTGLLTNGIIDRAAP